MSQNKQTKKRNKQTRYRGNPGKLKIQRRRQNPGSAIHVRVCFGAKTLITAPSPRLSFLIYAVGGWCPLAAVWGHGETLLVKSNTGWGFPSTLCNQGPGVRNGVYGHRRVSVFFGNKTFCSQVYFIRRIRDYPGGSSSPSKKCPTGQRGKKEINFSLSLFFT